MKDTAQFIGPHADMIKKSDIIAGIVAGELIALFFWVLISTAGIEPGSRWDQIIRLLRWPAFLAIPVLTVLGLFAADILARRWMTIFQLAKFLVVGTLNTFLDLGVFNILKFSSGITEAGIVLTMFKGISFMAAVSNSFVWNKLWVFEKRGTRGAGKQFGVFFAVSAVGILLNTGAFYVLTAVIGAPQQISDKLWHNISVVLAGIMVFTWNFLGYKFIVFGTNSAPKASAPE